MSILRLRSALAVLLLTLSGLGLGAGTALALPEDHGGRYGGADVVGIVKYRGSGKGDCEGPSLYVTQSARNNNAVRSMGPAAAGWVCVDREAYNNNPVGSVWTGDTGGPGTIVG